MARTKQAARQRGPAGALAPHRQQLPSMVARRRRENNPYHHVGRELVDPMMDFMNCLFGHAQEQSETTTGSSSKYQARFTLAAAEHHTHSKDKKTPTPSHSFLTTDLIETCLHHDAVLSFLAPHEVLSLWRTCRACWSLVEPGRKKKAVMLSNVFHYFRISEEAALRVHQRIEGKWNTFFFFFFNLCQEFAKVYHHLEPDPVHRAFVAEQVCFRVHDGAYFMGKLASFENWNEEDNVWSVDERGREKEPPPTVKQLREESPGQYRMHSLRWGQPNQYHNVHHDVGEPRRNTNEMVNKWTERNREWMREHAEEAPHQHYKRRVEKGLYPLICVGEIWDTEYGCYEWSLDVGPDLQQTVVTEFTNIDLFNSRLDYYDRFYYCQKEPDLEGGMIEYLLGFPCAKIQEYDNDPEMRGPRPTLGIAIWCLRHSFKPLTDTSIDWVDLIDKVCEHDDEGVYDEEAQEFFKEALASPLYGPADANKWVKTLADAPSPASVQWYNSESQGKHPHELTWSSFASTLEGLENCFLYLDAPWSYHSRPSKQIMDDFSGVLFSDPSMQAMYPNAHIIHVIYRDWSPNKSEFHQWWATQYPDPNEEGSEQLDGGNYFDGGNYLIHVQRGRIFSTVINVSKYVGEPDKEEIPVCLRLLYLFSFGNRDHSSMGEKLKESRFWGCVKVPPDDSRDHTGVLEQIASLHEQDEYVVGEYGGGGWLVRSGGFCKAKKRKRHESRE